MPVREIAECRPRDFPLNYDWWHRAGIAMLTEELARHGVTEFPVKIVTLDTAWLRQELRIYMRSLGGL